jgi:Zn-dependent M28 family amino/carboxypeptidase
MIPRTRLLIPTVLACILALPAAELQAGKSRNHVDDPRRSAVIRVSLRFAEMRVRQATAPKIDEAQLICDVEVLAADDMEGRRAGTLGGAKARVYVLQRFKEVGLKPLTATYEHPFTFAGRSDLPQLNGTNLLGLIRGTVRPDRYIVVTAHYDHVGVRERQVFNGADDNATGVAALLAIAAHFVRNPPETSLIIAALDAEESGLRGARALLASDAIRKDAIVMNVNIDMIGRDTNNVLYASGTHHYPALKPFLEGVAQPPVELRLGHDVPGTKIEDWTSSSDHAPFHQAGIPFIYFGVEDFENHHKASDDAETIQREFFAGTVRTIVVAVDRFAKGMK